MPTWRKLHTKTVESFDVNDMPDDFTRLLWVLLPTQLCQHGRGPSSPAWVRSNVFPLRDDVTLEMVTEALAWYTVHDMIEHYKVNGRGYFYIPTWKQYQGDTSKEGNSIYPAPDSASEPEPSPIPTESPPEPIQTNSGASPELVRSNSGVTPELVQSNSSTDVDADVEVEVEVDAVGATRAPPDPPPPRKSRAKPKKPTPAAVTAFREVAHRFPAKSWYAKIAAAVGEDEADLEFWRQVVDEWVGLGWKPTNAKGMLDCYNRRELPSSKSARHRPQYTPSDYAISDDAKPADRPARAPPSAAEQIWSEVVAMWKGSYPQLAEISAAPGDAVDQIELLGPRSIIEPVKARLLDHIQRAIGDVAGHQVAVTFITEPA